MSFLTISLFDNHDKHGGNTLPGVDLEVANNGQSYYLYKCSKEFQANRPLSLTFVRDNATPETSNIYHIAGKKDYFHFYFASTVNLGEEKTISASDTHITSHILQARMDTGTVLVIEDANNFMNNRPTNFPQPIFDSSITTNEKGCKTFTLAEVSGDSEMVYIFAYQSSGSNYYLLQAGICSQKDERFPLDFVVNRLGIEFFTDTQTNDSLSDSSVPVTVFTLTLEQVPLCWRYLLPYFTGKWPKSLYNCL